MFSTIDRNCHHLRQINFLHLHIQIQRTGMDREWVFTLPIFNKLVLTNISPYPTMFSKIDRNCRHLRHINFVRLHIQIQRTGMDGEWVFQQTCPRHDFGVKKNQNINIMNEI